MQFHPHSGSWPAALLNGGRGDPDSAADRSGNSAGGVGQPPQPAGPKDGPHRGYRQGSHSLSSSCNSLCFSGSSVTQFSQMLDVVCFHYDLDLS